MTEEDTEDRNNWRWKIRWEKALGEEQEEYHTLKMSSVCGSHTPDKCMFSRIIHLPDCMHSVSACSMSRGGVHTLHVITRTSSFSPISAARP